MKMSPRILKGRTRIYTSVDFLNSANVVDELAAAFAVHHQINEPDIRFLMDYHLGEHGILTREKVVREDIDNKVVINYAQAATRDITGYYLGKPIEYVCRDNTKRGMVEDLRDYATYEDKDTIDFMVAENQSICGVGYKAVFPDTDDEDEVPFELTSLDPRTTFVVYSTKLGNAPVWCCAFHVEKRGNDVVTVFNVYDKYTSFVLESGSVWDKALVKEEAPHLIGGLPIVEFPNNQWRIGDWETSISLMDAIDTTASDSVNDVSQFVQSFLAIIGAELPDPTYDDDGNIVSDPVEDFKRHRILQIPQGDNSGSVDVKYLANTLDPAGVASLRDYLEASYRVVVGVPDRKTRGGGGGDTGDAVYMRDGWQDIDLVASTKETFAIAAEKEVIRRMLTLCKDNNLIGNLTVRDIDIKFSRNKSANGVSKANMYSILHGTKTMAPEDALALADLTTDTTSVIKNGEAYWEKKNAENAALFSQNTENPDAGQADATDNGGADGL